MEFNEKLQELRKNMGLTQEELAKSLYVSRTAISKWESGRGYPSIESLKDISKFFSVTIDDLLSGDKLLSIAEKENKSNIRKIYDKLFCFSDVCFLALIFLPLYPNSVDGFVYSVNLFNYTQMAALNKTVFLISFLSLIFLGILGLLVSKIMSEKSEEFLMNLSLVINIISVISLGVTREAYAIVIAFLLLIIKTVFFIKYLSCKIR